MSDDEGRIAKSFASDDGQRQQELQRARLCAALSKPWLLPMNPVPVMGSSMPAAAQGAKLPEPYQSLGASAVTHLEGRIVLSLWTPGWFRLMLPEHMRIDPSVDIELIRTAEAKLFMHELIIMGVLESANLIRKGRVRVGFRTAKRRAISQVLAVGECLEHLDDEYRLKVFRLDQYVTRRDTYGDVLYHIVREDIDLLTLSDSQLATVGLNTDDHKSKPVRDRMQTRYTRVEWQPRSRKWVIEREVNKVVYERIEEPVSPYFSTTYELAPDEHYGHGYIEQRLGAHRSLNSLSEKLLDFAAAASKHHPIIDPSSELRPDDLEAPTGTPLVDHVKDGAASRIAFLKVDKLGDFGVVFQTWDAVRKDLAKSALMESEAAPQQERVTREQILGVRAELEGALGGVYTAIADEQQIPLLQRTIFQAQRDKLLPTLPDDKVQIVSLTGLEALTRAAKTADLIETAGVIAQLGEEAARRVDVNVLVDVLARYRGLDEPGIIKSPKVVEEEKRAEQQREIEMVAAQEAAKAGGRIAERTATGG